MAYLLDADVFIQAKNLHYGFEFCPAFWDWLIAANTARNVFSIEKVADELKAGSDELADWAGRRAPGFFLEPGLGHWPAIPTSGGLNTFLQLADYYLVAHALAHGQTVVTHEIPSTSTKRIKIPDACLGLRIKCVTPFEMLRNEKARFILGPHP